MDFPAAHSMDTMWFAVDADGHVAVFDSGEGGGVPDAAYVDDPYGLARALAATGDDDFDLDLSDPDNELAARGVYCYRCDDGIAVPYTRLAVPRQPLVLADAPAEVRAHAIRFAGTFAGTPELQPAEHWKSSGWSAGWLATDGKTMRPFPGRERDLAKELEHYPLGSEYEVMNEVLERPDGELAEPAPTPPPPPKPWWKLW
jgi:hypothetical protein